jgi:hypothetical protein
MGSDGRLYNINTAPSNLTYAGVFTGYTVTHPRWGITEAYDNPLIAPPTIYEGAYAVGRDAGTLTVSVPTDVFEATIDAGVVTGAEQDAARPTGAAATSLLPPNGNLDSFLLPNATVPLSGSLELTNLAIAAGFLPFATNVEISDSIAPLVASLGADTPLPAARQDTAWLSASLLDSAGLGGPSIVTSSAITIASPLTLADGGRVSLLSPATGIEAPLATHGGDDHQQCRGIVGRHRVSAEPHRPRVYRARVHRHRRHAWRRRCHRYQRCVRQSAADAKRRGRAGIHGRRSSHYRLVAGGGPSVGQRD